MRRVAGVLLEGDDVTVAALLARLGVAHLQRVNGTVPAAALRLRDELAAFAARETSAVAVSGRRESGNPAAVVAVADSHPSGMTAASAAGLLDVSAQAVRGMCRSGALIATRSPAGRWRIDAGSAVALAARRREGLR